MPLEKGVDLSLPVSHLSLSLYSMDVEQASILLFVTREGAPVDMAAGSIRVDIDQLSIIVSTLSLIKLSLDAEAGSITKLNTQVDEAIQGTAPSIGIFDGQFQSWASDLQRVAGEMDEAYTILSKALMDARKLVGDL